MTRLCPGVWLGDRDGIGAVWKGAESALDRDVNMGCFSLKFTSRFYSVHSFSASSRSVACSVLWKPSHGGLFGGGQCLSLRSGEGARARAIPRGHSMSDLGQGGGSSVSGSG